MCEIATSPIHGLSKFWLNTETICVPSKFVNKNHFQDLGTLARFQNSRKITLQISSSGAAMLTLCVG